MESGTKPLLGQFRGHMKHNCPVLRLVLFSFCLFAISPLSAQNEKTGSSQSSADPSAPRASESIMISGAAPKTGTTFSSRSELVLVPVLVTDGSGKHVSGLKKEDFAIKEDGKVQSVKFLEEIVAKPSPTTLPAQAASVKASVTPSKLAPATYSNQAEEQAPLRIVIILFDMLNSHFKDQVPARRQVVEYLKEDVEPGTLVCLMGLGRGGLRMYHDLTTDAKGLGTALEVAGSQGRHAIAGNLSIGSDDKTPESASSQSFVGHGEFAETGSSGRKDRKFIVINTLEAFRNIAGAYAGVPGRKSLIWVTTGFPFTLDGYKTGSMPGLDKDSLMDILPDYERTWQVLNDANVALYPVDMHGLLNTSAPDATYRMRRGGSAVQQLGKFSRDRQDKNADNLGTLQTFADMTGGKAFYNNNDLVAGFRAAEADSNSSYLLGFYLQKDEKPGWHKIHVELSRPGMHVRARSGYFVARQDHARPDGKDTKDVDVQLAMSSPMNFTGVPITIKWLGVVAPKPTDQPTTGQKQVKKTVAFQISIPSHAATIDEGDGNRVSLNFIAMARTESADEVADFVKKIDGQLKPEIAKRMQEAGLKFDSTMQVPPGHYNVRFVVRDNLSGRVGSVTAPLTVQ
jgi:VWFA-related protein